MNHASITNQTSAQLIADDHWGKITDFYLAASGGVGGVALYDGTSSSASLLLLQEAASNQSIAITNMQVEFTNHGVYAVVTSNVLALTVHGQWTKTPVATVLSGG